MDIVVKEIKTKSVLTKSNLPVSDYSVNPYIGCTHGCKYCYASFMKRFTNHKEKWGEFIDVKYWDEEKNLKKYENKELFISSATDPYNQYEESYKRTRSLLEQFKGCNVKISIQTKSDLVLRDLDLIKSYKDIRVGFSINTLDEEFKNDMDKAVSIERRIKAMEILHENKIRTTCFISPIFPGITDVVSIIERVKDKCNLIWLENLNLRGSYKADILNYISEKYPHLVSLYDQIYNKHDRTYFQMLDRKLKEYANQEGLKYVVNDDTMKVDVCDKPIIVNYFYHEEIKKSAVRKNKE